MRHARRFRMHALITMAIGASFCAVASDALNYGGADSPEQQVSRTPLVRNRTSPSMQQIDQVPLKRGIWEMSVYQGTQVVDDPYRQALCADSPPWVFFPRIFPAENFGRVLQDKVIVSDYVWRLADGRYRVTGGAGTTRGGAVTYVHLITLHGDDHYDDELTVTSHADTHPTKRVYSGRGHWVAPCSDQAQ